MEILGVGVCGRMGVSFEVYVACIMMATWKVGIEKDTTSPKQSIRSLKSKQKINLMWFIAFLSAINFSRASVFSSRVHTLCLKVSISGAIDLTAMRNSTEVVFSSRAKLFVLRPLMDERQSNSFTGGFHVVLDDKFASGSMFWHWNFIYLNYFYIFFPGNR